MRTAMTAVGLIILLATTSALALDHSGTISSDATWFAADNPHVVVGTVTVNAAVTLTIEPGCEILLNGTRQITINGSLVAIGTPGQEIHFTRSGASLWGSLRFSGAGSGSLAYCNIEYATYGIYHSATGTVSISDVTISACTYGVYANGGPFELASTTISDCSNSGIYGSGIRPTLLDDDVVIEGCETGIRLFDLDDIVWTDVVTVRGAATAGVHLDNCSTPSLDDLVLTGNTGTHGALYFENCGDVTLGAGNVIGGAAQENSWPLSISAGSYLTAASVIPTSGNTSNAIRVAGGASTRSGVWRRFTDLDYVVAGSPQISAGGSLTIEPGIRLQFGGTRAITVYGSFTAVGTPGAEITFTRSGASLWSSLQFNGAGSGTIAHCVVEYATYGVHHTSSGTVSIADAIIRNCTYGTRADEGPIEIASTTYTNNTNSGFYGLEVAPTLLDDDVVFDNSATGVFISDVPDLDFTMATTIRNTTTSGLHLDGCSYATVDNITLTGNVGDNGAVYLEDCGDVTLGAANVIGGPLLENSWPVTITAGSFLTAGSVIPETGNTRADIRVASGATSRVGTWRLFSGHDYVAAGSPQISAGGSLTIEPGVTVRITASREFSIYGSLTAVGAPDAEILFTRDGSSAWSATQFNGAGSGTLSHCVIEGSTYGILHTSSGAVTLTEAIVRDCSQAVRVTSGTLALGSTTLTGDTYGIYAQGVAPTLLDGDVIIENAGTGLYIRDVAGLDWSSPVLVRGCTSTGVHLHTCPGATLNGLVLSGNTGANGAVLLQECGDVTLGADNVIGGSGQENSWPVSLGYGAYLTAASVIPTSGNQHDAIRIDGGSSAIGGTWRRFPDLDYVLQGNAVIAAGGHLTIDPGVRLRCDASRTITIRGALTAVGTVEDTILFTATGASNWGSVSFDSGGSGTLAHCTIEGANYGFLVSTTDTVTIADSVLRENGTGVRGTGGTFRVTRCQIIENDNYGIHLTGATPLLGSSLDEWNDIYGNGGSYPGRDFANGAADVDAHFVYWGTMNWTEILDRINDHYDDDALGNVSYVPYANASHTGVVVAAPELAPDAAIPARFALQQNAPNPFNPSTVIVFDLTRPSPVSLRIYDVAGELVATLVDAALPAGRHQRVWQGEDDHGRSLGSGVYFYRLESQEGMQTRRMLLVK